MAKKRRKRTTKIYYLVDRKNNVIGHDVGTKGFLPFLKGEDDVIVKVDLSDSHYAHLYYGTSMQYVNQQILDAVKIERTRSSWEKSLAESGLSGGLNGNAASEFLSSDFSQIKRLIRRLDMFDDNVNQIVRDAFHKGADIILAEQRRLAPYNLSEYIEKSSVHTNRNNEISVNIGYQPDTFYPDEDGLRYGIIGMTWEFGRPGSSEGRTGSKMRQIRKRIPNKKTAKRKDWDEAVPTEVMISKGTIQPVPHIRRGFDNVKEQAAQAVWDSITSELENIFNE